jgi:hypothetical protein
VLEVEEVVVVGGEEEEEEEEERGGGGGGHSTKIYCLNTVVHSCLRTSAAAIFCQRKGFGSREKNGCFGSL